MTAPLTTAKIYGLIEIARLRVGPAITSMSAASVAVANGTADNDVRDAIGRATLLLQDSLELLIEADKICKELGAVS